MTEKLKNKKVEKLARILRKYLIEENGGITIDELARRLVDEGVKPQMPKLLGNKKCKDFGAYCEGCPLSCLQDCYYITNDNYTLFEIIEDKKEELDYLYEPIMAKLNEEV